ncbi:limbic system-associated membrane protein [Bombyx mori]|uniref:Hemolin n=1 Tax=Bombyx mori TaxID=7091 RepID=A0A8R1WLV2_BOMMO|nr:limbic system-associated membrane protein [Bombyx mori]
MKWLFYLIVLVYMLYRAVYAKETNRVTVDKIDYYRKSPFWKAGSRHSINCKGSSKSQKIEWTDPAGKAIKQIPSNRVYALEHSVPSPAGRIPASLLHFKSVTLDDTGLYTCRSGDSEDHAEVCVIDPVVFKNIRTELTADLGRSITLNCHAKGNPEPRIQWKRNDNLINEGQDDTKYKLNTKFSSDGFESSLTIFSLTSEDSGLYSCVAIQENTEQCKHSNYVNTTLNVNHAPIFEDGNDTELVYGRFNQSINLVCSARGYPAPTYRWFSNINDSTLIEFDKKQIEFNQEANTAILTVTVNQTETFKCSAKNEYGEAEKDFKLVETTTNPAGGFEIQYLHVSGFKEEPSENDWKNGELVTKEFPISDDDPDFKGSITKLSELEKNMNYWVRIRVSNSAGVSTWSTPIQIGALTENEDLQEEPQDEEISTERSKSIAVGNSDVTFYGIFFAGGILVVAAVCMFVMRMV